ncbi:glycosyl transferase [Clostridium sp. CM027]|uniref:glycosyl transferase n=1 Tax=Clostridium sp. CM027 TaxID=2849865 RepID=UPI001C6E4080|nr:glycosyl transferase [Clostridium sp. CM027]MBW9144701.1 glycosyl transferase [Clostridium sp. CM027]UVE40549.1 glycosyl transferase [Clostridium sp. CM027]
MSKINKEDMDAIYAFFSKGKSRFNKHENENHDIKKDNKKDEKSKDKDSRKYKEEYEEENKEEDIEDYRESDIEEYKQRCSFCTIVSKDYLIKTLTFYYSLERNSENFHLWICCIDDIIYSSLSKMNLKNASLIHLNTVEDQQLLAVKNTRKTNEYCWTLKAAVIRYVLMNYSVNSIIYCDSDIFFFSDPQMVFDEWGEASVFLCPQRDLEWVHKIYGKFQAGFIGFKKDIQGLNCLNWWNQKCIEWCSGEPDSEMGRWGDQKYLDKITGMFSNVKISRNLGIDAAPWNTIYNNNFNITSKDNEVFIEGDKLIAYHFACLSIFNENDYDLWTFNYLEISSAIKSNIYIPYIESLRNTINVIRNNLNEKVEGLFNKSDSKEAQTLFKYSDLTLAMARYNDFYSFCTITSKAYLLQSMSLYSSLKDKIDNFNLFICCMDEISFSVLSNLKLENTIIINVSEVEDMELLHVKETRNMQEYCWSLKAPLVLYILDKYAIDSVIYCDADIFFFSDPMAIFKQWKDYDTLICPQRDCPEFEKVHGHFQAGFLGFRNRKSSLAILNWWKKKCIEWCSDKPDIIMERWGDQKYLDKVPNLFYSIKILDDLGIDAAPWNLIINNDYKVYNDNNTVLIDDRELMVYHFGSMKIFDESVFDLWKLDPLIFSKEIIDNIYIPYLDALCKSMEILKSSGLVDLKELFSKEEVTNAKNLYRFQS